MAACTTSPPKERFGWYVGMGFGTPPVMQGALDDLSTALGTG